MCGCILCRMEFESNLSDLEGCTLQVLVSSKSGSSMFSRGKIVGRTQVSLANLDLTKALTEWLVRPNFVQLSMFMLRLQGTECGQSSKMAQLTTLLVRIPHSLSRIDDRPRAKSTGNRTIRGIEELLLILIVQSLRWSTAIEQSFRMTRLISAVGIELTSEFVHAIWL